MSAVCAAPLVPFCALTSGSRQRTIPSAAQTISGPCAEIAHPSKMTHCSPCRCQFLPRTCPRHDQSPPGVPRRSKLRLGSQARASRCKFARHRQS